MKPLTTHEEFCLKNSALFVAALGRTPATRTREQFATLPDRPQHALSIPSMVDLAEFKPERRPGARAVPGIAPHHILIG